MSQLTRFDPFAELNALQKQFFGGDWMSSLKSVNIPTTDVYTDDGNNLIVEAHLPNFSDKDIDVHVENGNLIIQAEKHEKEEDKKKKYVVRESSSSFYRSIRLSKQADSDEITASMENGILKVTVPYKELPAPKKIAIGTGNKAKK